MSPRAWLLACLPAGYRRRRKDEIEVVLDDSLNDGRLVVAELAGLMGLVLRTRTLALTGLDAPGGLAARRLLTFVLPLALLVPIGGWLAQPFIWPRATGWIRPLTWDANWRAWALWTIALIMAAAGRTRTAGWLAAFATALYALVLIHFALRNNPRTLVEEIGWVVLQVAATVALLTSPARSAPATSRQQRLRTCAVSLASIGLLTVGAAHAAAEPWGFLWLFSPPAFIDTALIVAVPVGLVVLMRSPAARLALPLVALAGADLVAGRCWMTSVGDYGPTVPGWGGLRPTDLAILVAAPVAAFLLARILISILRDAGSEWASRPACLKIARK